MTVYGCDLSDFDWSRGPVDVAAMYRDGIRFVTHKATEGTKTVHTHYGTVLGRAHAADMPVLGAYHVVRTPGSGGHGPIAAQAEFFLTYLDAQTPWWREHPHFILQVDLEKWGYDPVAPGFGVQLADLLKAKTGRTVVLYAPRWAYGDSIAGSHPLWASDYGANPTGHYTAAYPGDQSSRWRGYSGRTPAILQFGSRLTVANQHTVDVNAFRGSLDDLRAFAAGAVNATNATAVAPGEDEGVHVNLKAGESEVFTSNAVVGGKGWLCLSAAFGDCDVRVARFINGTQWTDAEVQVKDAGTHWSFPLDGAAGDKVTVENHGPGRLAIDTFPDRPWS